MDEKELFAQCINLARNMGQVEAERDAVLKDAEEAAALATSSVEKIGRLQEEIVRLERQVELVKRDAHEARNVLQGYHIKLQELIGAADDYSNNVRLPKGANSIKRGIERLMRTTIIEARAFLHSQRPF